MDVNAAFYPLYAETCHRLEKYAEAMRCAAKAKARMLAHQLALADFAPPTAAPELITELHHLRDQMRRISWLEPASVPRDDPVTWLNRDRLLKQLRKRENEVVDAIANSDVGFADTVRGKIEDAASVGSLMAENEILMEFLVSPKNTLVFIVTKQTLEEPDILMLKGWGTNDLASVVTGYPTENAQFTRGFLRLYHEKRTNDWYRELQNAVLELYERLFMRASADGRSLEAVLGKHRARLRKQFDELRLTIVPHHLLHFIPFEIFPFMGGNTVNQLIDVFTIGYVPSTTVLCQARRRQRTFENLCAYADPDGCLPGSRVEVDSIARFFPVSQQTVLQPGKVKKSELLKLLPHASVFHAAGHGEHNFDDFTQSYLKLSHAKLLLKEVFGCAHSDRMALAVLSACETGVPATSMIDEGLSFSGAFLQSGAKWVVSTRWQVDDLASCLLMTKMYDLIFRGGEHPGAVTPPYALTAAQRWLKDVSFDDGVAYLGTKGFTEESVALLLGDNTQQNFSNPYFWAGFYCSGA